MKETINKKVLEEIKKIIFKSGDDGDKLIEGIDELIREKL